MESSGLTRLGSLKVFIAADVREGGPVPPGAVVIPRRDAAKPNVYATAYEALRSRMEIMRRYGLRRGGTSESGEFAELAGLRGDLRETHVALLAGDAFGADDAFALAAASLKRKHNTHKSQARDKAKAGVVRHETSTVNRGATRARLAAIDRRIAAREDEVRSIAPWIGAMETALLLEIGRSEEVIADLDRTVQAMSRHELVRKGSTSERQRKALAARLRLAEERLATLMAAPFRCARVALAAPMLRATVAAEHGSADGFSEALAAVGAVTAAVAARAAVEHVLILLVAGSPPSAVLAAAERAGRRLAKDGRIPAKSARAAVATLRLAYRSLKKGDGDAAKARLKEAVSSLQNPA
ncbi:MAG: hypothetical protein RL272_67 [Candidatus Parcubacteria bacterium]